MKYLKLFEGFNSEDIDSICRKYNIRNYTINDDGSIDVDGDVELLYEGLTELPLRFRRTTGGFYCSSNHLHSLEGCPKEVLGGNFYCRNNQLKSLEGSPQEISGDFSCSNNQLTSLEGSPQEVGGDFSCSDNQLTSLQGGPQSVGGNFSCRYNKLTSLEGCPQEVGGNFYCFNNQLRTLEGCPQKIGGNFYSRNNKLLSLEGIGKVSGDIYCGLNPCFEIYAEWINTDRREELLDLMEDYDFLRGEEIYWERLEAFYKDSGLKIPNRKKLEKYYTIIE